VAFFGPILIGPVLNLQRDRFSPTGTLLIPSSHRRQTPHERRVIL
jgi:hypothetical protein